VEGIQPVLPVEILREAVESYAPVFWEPTQYR